MGWTSVWNETLAVAHEQTPFAHVWPLVQARPQPPQLDESVCVSTHLLEQTVWPCAQVQVPPWQVAPPGQAFPQVPQFASSVDRS